jgi:hypothetical protein
MRQGAHRIRCCCKIPQTCPLSVVQVQLWAAQQWCHWAPTSLLQCWTLVQVVARIPQALELAGLRESLAGLLAGGLQAWEPLRTQGFLAWVSLEGGARAWGSVAQGSPALTTWLERLRLAQCLEQSQNQTGPEVESWLGLAKSFALSDQPDQPDLSQRTVLTVRRSSILESTNCALLQLKHVHDMWYWRNCAFNSHIGNSGQRPGRAGVQNTLPTDRLQDHGRAIVKGQASCRLQGFSG